MKKKKTNRVRATTSSTLLREVKPTPWSCNSMEGHNFFRISEWKIACSKCGETRNI